MPKGYLIGHVTVNDAVTYKDYMRQVEPIFATYGAQYLARGGESLTPEGETQNRHVIIEFPDFASAKAAYDDPDYREVAEIRHASATSTIILVEGV